MEREDTHLLTIDKLRSKLPGIPDSDFLFVPGGYVAIRPDRLPEVRAAVAAQSQYLRWLDREYVVDRRWFDPDQPMYCVRPKSADPGMSTLTAFVKRVRMGDISTDTDADEHVSAVGVGIATVLCLAEKISYEYSHFGTMTDEGADSWSLTWTGHTFLDVATGARMKASGSRKFGGVPQGAVGYRETGRGLSLYDGQLEVVDELPAITTGWPLVVGPAALTRAEVYPMLEWCAVEASTLADILSTTTAGLGSADKAKADREIGKLRAMGRDLVGWFVSRGVNPYSITRDLAENAAMLIDSRETIDGKDWGVVNDRIKAFDGRVPFVFSFEDDLDPVYTGSDLANYPMTIQLVVSTDGTVAAVGGIYHSLGTWLQLVLSLRRAGRTFTVVRAAPITNVELAGLCDSLEQAASRALPANEGRWSTQRGDSGAIGYGMIGAAASPASAGMRQLINIFTTPGFMDYGASDV